jgi:HEAT repeat protein
MRCRQISPWNAAVLSSVLSIMAIAQDVEIITNSQHRTVAGDLRAHGIELSEQSLIAALGNKEPIVRSLAANKLIADRGSDAIPFIEAALSIEKDPTTRLGMATALSAIGDTEGIEHLQRMCNDATLSFRVELSCSP